MIYDLFIDHPISQEKICVCSINIYDLYDEYYWLNLSEQSRKNILDKLLVDKLTAILNPEINIRVS